MLQHLTFYSITSYRTVYGQDAGPGGRAVPFRGGRLRKGGRCGWEPSSSSNFSIRAFRGFSLIEVRQTVLCRAIRADSISINSSLPPSYDRAPGLARASIGSELAAERGRARVHWEREDPLDNATEQVNTHWNMKLKIHRKTPVNIHNDF